LRVAPVLPNARGGGQVYHEYVSGAITPFGIDFDVFVYKRKELYGMLVGAFEKHGLLATLVRAHSVLLPRMRGPLVPSADQRRRPGRNPPADASAAEHHGARVSQLCDRH